MIPGGFWGRKGPFLANICLQCRAKQLSWSAGSRIGVTHAREKVVLRNRIHHSFKRVRLRHGHATSGFDSRPIASLAAEESTQGYHVPFYNTASAHSPDPSPTALEEIPSRNRESERVDSDFEEPGPFPLLTPIEELKGAELQTSKVVENQIKTYLHKSRASRPSVEDIRIAASLCLQAHDEGIFIRIPVLCDVIYLAAREGMVDLADQLCQLFRVPKYCPLHITAMVVEGYIAQGNMRRAYSILKEKQHFTFETHKYGDHMMRALITFCHASSEPSMVQRLMENVKFTRHSSHGFYTQMLAMFVKQDPKERINNLRFCYFKLLKSFEPSRTDIAIILRGLFPSLKSVASVDSSFDVEYSDLEHLRFAWHILLSYAVLNRSRGLFEVALERLGQLNIEAGFPARDSATFNLQLKREYIEHGYNATYQYFLENVLIQRAVVADFQSIRIMEKVTNRVHRPDDLNYIYTQVGRLRNERNSRNSRNHQDNDTENTQSDPSP